MFQLFDREARGSLSAEELSDLMGALLGVPQANTAQLYTEACRHGRLTEGEALLLITNVIAGKKNLLSVS